MTTVAQAHRQLVGDMFSEGVEVEEIARRVGISVDRVDAILDQLDGVEHQDDAHRAPAVEPVRPEPRPLTDDRQPIVVGSKARVVPTVPPKPVEVRPVPELTDEQRSQMGVTPGGIIRPPVAEPADPEPARETEPEPEPVKSTPTPVRPSPEPVKPAERPAAEHGYGVREHGTVKGARQHWGHKEELCDPCRAAYNDWSRENRKPRTGPRPCGTQAAYNRHLRHGEKPCEACVAAHSEYMRSYRDRPVLDKPEGAVALLTLPISVPHLIAVSDALELAYGPGLRIVGADGGFWVLGRAS